MRRLSIVDLSEEIILIKGVSRSVILDLILQHLNMESWGHWFFISSGSMSLSTSRATMEKLGCLGVYVLVGLFERGIRSMFLSSMAVRNFMRVVPGKMSFVISRAVLL